MDEINLLPWRSSAVKYQKRKIIKIILFFILLFGVVLVVLNAFYHQKPSIPLEKIKPKDELDKTSAGFTEHFEYLGWIKLKNDFWALLTINHKVFVARLNQPLGHFKILKIEPNQIFLCSNNKTIYIYRKL